MNFYKKLFFLHALIFLWCIKGYSQIGGKKSYEAVDVPVNARIAGEGGANISLRDKDPNLFLQNPASLNDSMLGGASINYSPYLGKVHSTQLAYAGKFKKVGLIGVGLQYFDYGKMQETDPTGNITGEFHPRDFVITVSKSHKINHFALGANLKFAGSRLAAYSSSAVMLDLGGQFVHPKKDFVVALEIRNAGFAIKNFVKGEHTALPFDVRIGTSFKPEHMPLRFSITAHHLQKFDIYYLDTINPVSFDLNGKPVKAEKKFGDQILTHFVFGGEFILSKNFHVRAGYNFQRRKELKLETRSGGAGFSIGAMIRISGFEFAYSRSIYTVAGAANYFTLTTDVNRFRKKSVKS